MKKRPILDRIRDATTRLDKFRQYETSLGKIRKCNARLDIIIQVQKKLASSDNNEASQYQKRSCLKSVFLYLYPDGFYPI